MVTGYQAQKTSQISKRESNRRLLLFSALPFRDESSLILDNETAEEAFHRLMDKNSSAYHAKLQRMLDAV